jgi:hypothetical protein
MSDHIVPTQEHLNLAREYLADSFMPSASDVDKLAHILAQREHLAMSKGAAIAWGSLWDSTAPADVIKVAEDVKSVQGALDIYVGNDEKADALLKRAGYDDTTNVVPRLAALVDEAIAARARIADLEADASVLAIEWAKIEAAHLQRIAELERIEAKLNAACGMNQATIKRAREREATHITHIKALRHVVRWCLEMGMRMMEDEARQALADTDHYDTKETADG